MSIWTDIVAVIEGAGKAGTGQNPIPAITSTETQGIFGGFWAGIGAGLESGVVAVLKDLWKAVEPFVEIGAAVIVFLITLGLAFKDDILGVAPMIASAAL